MPALLGFIPPPSLTPAASAPPATGSLQMTPGPITNARPITGGNYPSIKFSNPPPPPNSGPPPAAAAAAGAGGFSVGGALTIVAGAIAIILFTPEPAGQNDYDLHPPDPPKELEPPVPPPFRGGQGVGIFYRITYLNYSETKQAFGPNSITVYGPIDRIVQTYYSPDRYGYIKNTTEVFHRNYQGNPETSTVFSSEYYPAAGRTRPYTSITEIVRVDGQPDTGGDLPPVRSGSYSAPGNSLGAPSSAPPSAAPASAPGAPGISGSPSGSPGGSPSGFPGGSPSPAPAPNPGPAPQPNKYPAPYPSPSPSPNPNGSPGPSSGSGIGSAPAPTPNGAPRIGPSPYTSPPAADPTKYPDTGFQPNIFGPSPLLSNPLTPTGFTPNPKTGNPEPKAPPLTSPPPKTPAPQPTPNDDLFKQIQNLIVPIGIGLVGLTGLVQPEKLREAANAGTCQALAPGGCGARLSNDAASAAANSARNSTALSGILAFLQALQTAFLTPILAGVNLINTKLGPLMSGVNGIGGFLSRLSTSLGVDRALNLIAIASNLHNAMMLSANLKVTLLEMLSSVGNATGVLRTSENENVDLNQVFNAGIEAVLIKIVGVDSYAGLKVGLRKYNAIYQAATNSLNAVSGMFNAIGNVVEQAAENTGRIGNALKGAGVVSEKAYQWLAEKFDAKSSKFIKFQSTIGDVTQVLETINEIAETVVEGQQSATEFQKANKDFVEAVAAAKKEDGIENKAVQAEATKAKENATKDPTGEIETGLLSFLTN